MDSPDRRRRRQRFLRQTSSAAAVGGLSLGFPARWFRLMCCCSLALFSLLWYATHLGFSSFRPILRVPRLSLPTTYSSTAVESVDDFDSFLSEFTVENRVLFPDSVLLLLRSHELGKKNSGEKLRCVYSSEPEKDALSFNEHDEFRWAVRCPVQSSNYTDFIGLKSNHKSEIVSLNRNQTAALSFQYLVYNAVVDKNDVVVFVKGLNLRRNRLSDPSFFTCHFDQSRIVSKATMAAQEIIRCPVPNQIRHSDRSSVPVTIGIRSHRTRETALMPSVATISLGEPIRNQNQDGDQKKYQLCMCTMIWNQASSIREWITYHSYLGVEKWFVYDNNSDDDIESILDEFGNVTLRFWPWIKTQEAGFSHCALTARSECEWIAFTDVDEYFYFPSSSAPHSSLASLVSNFSASVGEIRTSCYSFGPSGLRSRPKRGVTVGYTCRMQNPERHKSIVRPDSLDSSLINVVHHFALRDGFRYVDLGRNVAVINHYKYQVWDVFRDKFYRRVATYVADWRENSNEGSRDRAPGLGTEAVEPSDWSLRFCEVWDTGIRDFVVEKFGDDSTGLMLWDKRKLNHI